MRIHVGDVDGCWRPRTEAGAREADRKLRRSQALASNLAFPGHEASTRVPEKTDVAFRVYLTNRIWCLAVSFWRPVTGETAVEARQP